jgi:hypothetical protein
LLLSGRFVPGGLDSVGIPDREDSSGFFQQQHDSRGSPRRDTDYGGNIVQRFEQTASSNIAAYANQSPVEQSQSGQRHNHATESETTNNERQKKRRASASIRISNQASSSSNDTNNLNRNINDAPLADIVPNSPPTPKLICPPSPPPAAPSAYALAVSRMVEMNADMEFAYARLMMLDHEQKKVAARLETLEKLQLDIGGG